MMTNKSNDHNGAEEQNSSFHSPTALRSAIKNNTFWDEIPVGPYKFVIKRIRDSDILLEAVTDGDFNKDERLPYWAELWPSSLALAEFIIDVKEMIEGKNVLEIGCGLGLAGISATACGAHVLFTDNDPFALEFTRTNFKRNFKRAAAVKSMDWRKPACLKPFDLILGADVLYEKRWISAVLAVITQCLRPGGTALIAEPNRSIAGSFFELVSEKGWNRTALLKRICVNDKLHLVTIHRIQTC